MPRRGGRQGGKGSLKNRTRRGKPPSTNLQAPENIQIPNFNNQGKFNPKVQARPGFLIGNAGRQERAKMVGNWRGLGRGPHLVGSVVGRRKAAEDRHLQDAERGAEVEGRFEPQQLAHVESRREIGAPLWNWAFPQHGTQSQSAVMPAHSKTDCRPVVIARSPPRCGGQSPTRRDGRTVSSPTLLWGANLREKLKATV